VAAAAAAGGAGGGLPPGAAVWITTGGTLPAGADTVVPVEDTEAVLSGGKDEEEAVVIRARPPPKNGVREAGSDVRVGDVLLRAGQPLTPPAIALLLSADIATVSVTPVPRIGVLSTGDELREAGAHGDGGGVVDSNRPMLLAAIAAAGWVGVDLGHVADDEAGVAARLAALTGDSTAADSRVDILVTTGGVSMGDRDYVKPAVAALGEVHFGRLAMKPGKPAMAASVRAAGSSRRTLLLALPGNPVSAWVCFHLLAAPVARILARQPTALPPTVRATLLDGIALDPERPEYHRACVWYDVATGGLVARSTGGQASSRLASAVQANALLVIPAGTGALTPPHVVEALLVGALLAPTDLPPAAADVTRLGGVPVGGATCACGARHAAPAPAPPPVASGGAAPHPSLTHAAPAPAGGGGTTATTYRVAVLTVSDRASRGETEDAAGPRAAAAAAAAGGGRATLVVSARAVVPDDAAAIRDAVQRWLASEAPPHLILTTGGTGFSVRDGTPEALRPLITRPAPGIAHAMFAASFAKTPMAAVSRYEAGMITPSRAAPGGTLVVQMPGSAKAVAECMDAIAGILPHALALLASPT